MRLCRKVKWGYSNALIGVQTKDFCFFYFDTELTKDIIQHIFIAYFTCDLAKINPGNILNPSPFNELDGHGLFA